MLVGLPPLVLTYLDSRDQERRARDSCLIARNRCRGNGAE
jgi:hypothetical protein